MHIYSVQKSGVFSPLPGTQCLPEQMESWPQNTLIHSHFSRAHLV